MTQESYKKELIKNRIYKALSHRNRRNRKKIIKHKLLVKEKSIDTNNVKRKVKRKVNIVNNIVNNIKIQKPKKRSSGCGCGR